MNIWSRVGRVERWLVRRVQQADRGLLAVVGFAMVLRIAFVLWASRGAPSAAVQGDQLQYWLIGHQVADGHGYTSPYTGRATAYYPMGWPVLIGASVRVFRWIGLGHFGVTAVVLLQLVFGVLAVWATFHLARAVAGRRVALLAAGIVAAFPSLIFGAANFSVESAFIAAYLCALVVVVRHDWTTAPSTKRLVAIGLAVGLASQIRPFSMPMLLGVGFAALIGGLGWRVALTSFGVTLACALVVFIPWTIRNAVSMHAFVPASTNLGDTMCMSRYPGSDGRFRWATHEFCGDSTLPEVQRNTANMKAALHFIRTHPLEEVRQWGRRFERMMATDHRSLDDVVEAWGQAESSRTRLPTLAWTADVYYWILLALSVPGMGLTVRRFRRVPAFAVVAVAFVTLAVIPIGLWGAIRFHQPFLPLLAIAAAVVVDALWRRPTGRGAASSPLQQAAEAHDQPAARVARTEPAVERAEQMADARD